MSIFSRSAAVRNCVLPIAALFAVAPAVSAPPQDETVINAANPAPGTVTRMLRVSYSDLNLNDPRDQSRFARRISEAADVVCADVPDTLWNKFAGNDYRHCYNNAVASAMTRLPAASQAASN